MVSSESPAARGSFAGRGAFAERSAPAARGAPTVRGAPAARNSPGGYSGASFTPAGSWKIGRDWWSARTASHIADRSSSLSRLSRRQRPLNRTIAPARPASASAPAITHQQRQGRTGFFCRRGIHGIGGGHLGIRRRSSRDRSGSNRVGRRRCRQLCLSAGCRIVRRRFCGIWFIRGQLVGPTRGDRRLLRIRITGVCTRAVVDAWRAGRCG